MQVIIICINVIPLECNKISEFKIIQVELYPNIHTPKYLSIDGASCVPKDSDTCLKNSPGWKLRTWACKDLTEAGGYKSHCNKWSKDARRCCPESCENTEPFNKTLCDINPSAGTCTYPNEAQCGNKYQSCLKRRSPISGIILY